MRIIILTGIGLPLMAVIGSGGLGFARSAPSEFRVPKILSRTAAALGQTGHPSPPLAMRTFRLVEQAIAAVNPHAERQSPKFHRLIDALVLEINAGALPPGFLWKRFLGQSQVKNHWNVPQLTVAPAARRGTFKFQIASYNEMLIWAQSYLVKKAAGSSQALERDGKALIRLDMEDLFFPWVTAGAQYSEKQLHSRRLRQWQITSPSIHAITLNTEVRGLFHSYYRSLVRVSNYFATTPTLKPMQALINRSDNRLPYADVAHVLAGVTGLRRRIGKEQYYNRWMLANLLWKFLCLAKARHNKPAAIQIETYIQSWKNRTKRWYLRRWLSEALTVPGKAPWRVWSPPIEVRLLHKP